MEQYYSQDNTEIKEAEIRLINNNIEHLIDHIYKNKELFNSPEIRVGLVMKIIIRSDSIFNSDVLQEVVEDLEFMLSNKEYLSKFKNPHARKTAVSEELSLVRKYIKVDETLSLNRRG
jgi:hypothetical protein